MKFDRSTEGMLALGNAGGAVRMAQHLISRTNNQFLKDKGNYPYEDMFELLWMLGQELQKLEKHRMPE